MADFSRTSTRRLSGWPCQAHWKPPVRIAVILAVAPFALAGCNASQTVNPSGPAVSGAVYPNYNPYNPVSYGQTSGFYAGR